MSITIPALSKIQCNVTPTEDSDLANKKYVDDTVAASSGGGGTPDRLTAGNIDSLAPDLLGQATYLAAQTAIASEYSAVKAYQIGDVCAYHGELWRRQFQAGSGIAPSSGGMLWTKVALASALGGGGSADKKTATVNSGDGTVDMSGNPEVIIDGASFFLVTIGLILSNLSVSGMLSVEVHVTYASAATRSAFKVSAWNGPVDVTWIRGSLADLSSAGTHIVRLRAFPNGSAVYAEYVGKY